MYARRIIEDRVAVGDDVFVLTDLGGGRVQLTPDPSSVTEVGTTIDADLLQPIEDAASVSVPQTRKVVVEGPGIQGGGTLSDDVLISSTPIPVVAGDGDSSISAIPDHLDGYLENASADAVSTRILPFLRGGLRIGFTLSIEEGTVQAIAQVRRNNLPVGALNIIDGSGDLSDIFVEDIDDWVQGDRLSIHLSVSSGSATISEVSARFEIVP